MENLREVHGYAAAGVSMEDMRTSWANLTVCRKSRHIHLQMVKRMGVPDDVAIVAVFLADWTKA